MPSDSQPELVVGTPDREERRSLVLKVGQKLDGIYTILDKSEPDVIPEAESDKVAESLGFGGSSTVYLASYRGMQKRAIKFLTLNKLSDSTGRRIGDFQRTFNRERVFLAALSHGNIAHFYDAGVYNNTEKEWPYVVIDFIDGKELLHALEDEDTSSQQAYGALSDVFRAVVHMHSRRVLHSDLKWENIKCRKSASGIEPVIVDLGTAHHVPAEGEAKTDFLMDEEPRVRFICTERICHELHAKYWNDVVNENDLQVLFPSHDIHSLGVLLDELRKNEEVLRKFREVIGSEGLIALDAMIYNILKSPEPKPNREEVHELKRARRYTSAVEVYQDWLKLPRTYLAPAGVPELSLAAEFKYTIATSAGRTVVITPRLSSVINHKLFQRLRRVPQLEMKLMSFPSATHTRYAHSMAVLQNTRYYLAHLLNDPTFRLLSERADLEATLLLSLLHDVGHYQLSHIFEDFAASQRAGRSESPWDKIDFDIPSDDDLFRCIINPAEDCGLRGGYEEAVIAAWRTSAKDLGLPEGPTVKWLADIIRDEFGEATYRTMLAIQKAIIAPKGKDENKQAVSEVNPAHMVLGAVLSSDIDADKVAYLTEDSARTGVNYGAGIDFDGLLGSLRMPAIHNINNYPILGITRKGLAAAQSISVGRNLMFGQVYLRHTDRAVTSMIKYAIARMLEERTLSVPKYIQDTMFKEYETSLRHLFVKFAEVETVKNGDEVNPIAGLLEGERRIYKTVFSTSRLLDHEKADEIGNKLAGKSFDNILRLQKNLHEVASKASGLTDIKPGEVLVDIPIKNRANPAGEHGGEVFVYPDAYSTKGEPLRGLTPFLKAITEQHTRENRVSRVFVAPRIAESGNYGGIVNQVSNYIESTYGG